MQYRFLFLLTFLYLPPIIHAQEVRKFVQENTIPVQTIEPDSAGYSDLVSVGKAIGDSRVVMLGEQDHGDAPTFLAKTRLIKYLHEQKGFNVLAFESDFFGLNEGWNKLDKTHAGIDTFLRKNIASVWTMCITCNELLYQYIPYTYTTSSPLQITGFDNQMMLHYSAKYLIYSLDSLCKLLQLPITKQANYSSEIIPLIDSLRYWAFDADANAHSYTTCYQYLTSIYEQLNPHLQKDDLWMMVVENLMQETRFFETFSSHFHTTSSIRDSQMAMNLNWLVKHKYAGEKIIVWAANGHIGKATYDNAEVKSFKSMGNYFTNDSLNLRNTYIMGFTFYEGKAGRIGAYTYDIEKPKTNGFENWIGKDIPYAFTSFSKMPDKSESFFMKGFGHKNLRRQWGNTFDGVFFIRNIYPCVVIK